MFKKRLQALHQTPKSGDTDIKQNKPKWIWALLVTLSVCAAPALVYCWRVFYSYGLYPFAHLEPAVLSAVLAGLVLAGWGIAFLLRRFVKSFSTRAATALFCVGLLFAFVNPPLQTPDEGQHFLRAYSISQGHLAFDANRGYPRDVDALFKTFSIAWTNAHDGNAIKGRTEGTPQNPGPQDVVRGECISNHYVDYKNLLAGEAKTVAAFGEPQENGIKEPVLFVLLPMLPQALGILLARLLGFGALGALYGARLANLAFYALLCRAALKNCRRYRPVFLTLMFLPLTLFLAASCSYDSMLLGLYFFAASYFCKDEITDRDMALFAVAVAVMSSVKINNLLWLALPLVLPRVAWKARMKKWHAALLVLGTFAVLYTGMTLYNVVAIQNYGPIGRMIEGVNQKQQLAAMLQNPLRTAAVFLGTLFENEGFVSQLGRLGNQDLEIPMLALLSPCVLLLGAALSVHRQSSLTPRSCFGLLGLATLYTGAVLAGLYVTYTPVNMVRVVGLQARYFLPVYLMLLILTAALLSHVLSPGDEGRGTARAVNLSLGISIGFGLCGALLLFQSYFVGPVALVPLG